MDKVVPCFKYFNFIFYLKLFELGKTVFWTNSVQFSLNIFEFSVFILGGPIRQRLSLPFHYQLAPPVAGSHLSPLSLFPTLQSDVRRRPPGSVAVVPLSPLLRAQCCPPFEHPPFPIFFPPALSRALRVATAESSR
jgi:hypothetical protein